MAWKRAGTVAAAFTVALALRAVPYGLVFQPDGLRFQENDPWFHMRTVQNLIRHFPRRSAFDPYTAMPSGQSVPTGPLFDYLIGGAAWVAGLGSPQAWLVDAVGAWFPAVLGALTVIPVYWLGGVLFSETAGLIAAFLIAVMPGSFFQTSLLGFTDHHVAESFFAALVLLFLALALERRHTVRYAALAGIALGAYLATRPAGVFLVAFVAAWGVVEALWDRRAPAIAALTLAAAGVCFLPVGGIQWSQYTWLALGAGFAATACAMLAARGAPSRLWYAGSIGAATLACAAIVFTMRTALAASLLSEITSRAGRGTSQTVLELRPLLTMYGPFSWRPVWEEFCTAIFLAAQALVYLAWRVARRHSPALALFTAWSAMMIGLAFAQNRNCYYAAVNVALLAGYACARFLAMTRGVERRLACTAVALLAIAPCIPEAIAAAREDRGPSRDWTNALTWLRDRTPEPMDSPEAFYRYYGPVKGAFTYPASAYGVMSWWDFGHWISAWSHRIPVSNPMQSGVEEAARFFTATDPAAAAAVMRAVRARYVVAAASMMVPNAEAMRPGAAEFLAMPQWIGREAHEFAEIYQAISGEGFVKPVMVFYPEYYRSMFMRLFVFDGEAAGPGNNIFAITYSEESRPGGRRLRTIRAAKQFANYEEAARYMAANKNEPIVLAGLNPARTCVPLEKLAGYRETYNSQPGPLADVKETIHAVKIFEFTER